jgi:hypothetical protein
LIQTLPEKPLIIGHSMAGMATLKLVEMGKAAAGVSIDGRHPKMFSTLSNAQDGVTGLWFFLL